MSILNKLDKAVNTNDNSLESEQYPDWVTSRRPASIELYKNTLIEFERITKEIENNSSNPNTNSNISKSRIAAISGVCKSLVTKRRYPELVIMIDEFNKKIRSEKLRSSNSAKKPAKLSTSNELKLLRKENKKLREEKYHSIVEYIYSSDLLDDRASLAKKLTKLREEKAELQSKARKLQTLSEKQTETIAKLYEVLTPKQKMKINVLEVI